MSDFMPTYIKSLRAYERMMKRMNKNDNKIYEGKINKKCLKILSKMLEMENESDLELLIKGIREKKYKYILTQDMGCGSTSNAVSQGDAAASLLGWKYKIQKPNGTWSDIDANAVPTIFGLNSAGNAVIGPEAFRYGPAAENFKTVPEPNVLDGKRYNVGRRDDVSLREIWGRYIAETFNTALTKASTYHSDIKKENVIFVVARPADKVWEQNIDSYKQLISEATGIETFRVITFSEAKAAMQYVKRYKKIGLDWKKGVVIIDLGASTIDVEHLAYVENDGKAAAEKNNADPTEFSIEMAGRDIDQLLGYYFLSSAYPAEFAKGNYPKNKIPEEAFFDEYRDDINMTKSAFSYYIRQIKENVCSGIPQQIQIGSKVILCDDRKLHDILSNEQFSPKCSDPHFIAYMNGGNNNFTISGTWYGIFRKFMEYVVVELNKKGKSFNTIIITGGTANLLDIRQQVLLGINNSKKFDENTGIVMLNDTADYESTVPLGSASYIGNIVKNTENIITMPDTLKAVIKEDLLTFAPDVVYDVIYPTIRDEVHKKFEEWIEVPFSFWALGSNYGTTVGDLKKEIRSIKFDNELWNDMINQSEAKIDEKKSKMIKTLKKIQSIMDSMAVSGKYSHKIDFKDIHLKMNKDVILTAMRDNIPEDFRLSGFWANLIFKFLRALSNLFIEEVDNDDRQLSKDIRKKMYTAFEEDEPLKEGIRSAIKKLFQEDYDESNGFEIADHIIEDLETDINQAMFLS